MKFASLEPNQISGANSFNETIEGIKNLVKVGANIAVSTVVSDCNYQELEKTIILIDKLKVKRVIFIFSDFVKTANCPSEEFSRRINSAYGLAKKYKIKIVDRRIRFCPPRAVNWNITSVCNYTCSYCKKRKEPARNNNSIVDNYEAIVNNFRRLPGRWNIIIGGGEPLIVRNIKEIFQALVRRTDHSITIVTNLSPGARKIIEILDVLGDKLGSLAASLHLEHSSPASFLQKAKIINKYLENRGETLTVNCVAEKKRLLELREIGRTFTKEGFRFQLQPKQNETGDGFEIYSELEEDIIREFNRTFGMASTNFYGSRCRAGVDYLIINTQGDECRCYSAAKLGKNKDSYLGNLYDGSIKLWKKPKKCNFTLCGCISPHNINIIETE